MKILILTDIHKDYTAAISAHEIERPEIVLDCGDHHEIKNLFGQTPHFYIYGNHEPENVSLDILCSPTKIIGGTIYEFERDNNRISFAGLDGNYSHSFSLFSVGEKEVEGLKIIPSEKLDILLVHESPLNANCSIDYVPKVISEIERIRPKFVFAGHSGEYSEDLTRGEIKITTLDSIVKGYGLLNITKNKTTFQRKIARYR